jgi:hypothetical protein
VAGTVVHINTTLCVRVTSSPSCSCSAARPLTAYSSTHTRGTMLHTQDTRKTHGVLTCGGRKTAAKPAARKWPCISLPPPFRPVSTASFARPHPHVRGTALGAVP